MERSCGASRKASSRCFTASSTADSLKLLRNTAPPASSFSRTTTSLSLPLRTTFERHLCASAFLSTLVESSHGVHSAFASTYFLATISFCHCCVSVSWAWAVPQKLSAINEGKDIQSRQFPMAALLFQPTEHIRHYIASLDKSQHLFVKQHILSSHLGLSA